MIYKTKSRDKLTALVNQRENSHLNWQAGGDFFVDISHSIAGFEDRQAH